MHTNIQINDYTINAYDVEVEYEPRFKVGFGFLVNHEEYHDITTLLYKNDFTVTIPKEDITFPATISNYSTSITNLYEKDAVGEFKLELSEKEYMF